MTASLHRFQKSQYSPANKHDDIQRSGRIIGHGSVSKGAGLPFASLLCCWCVLRMGRVRSPEEERQERAKKQQKQTSRTRRTLFLFSLTIPIPRITRYVPYDEVSPQKTACWGQMKPKKILERPLERNNTRHLSTDRVDLIRHDPGPTADGPHHDPQITHRPPRLVARWNSSRHTSQLLTNYSSKGKH